MKFLQSSWVIALIGCATYLGSTLAFLKPGKIIPAHAQEPGEGGEAAPEAVLSGPSWDFNNPEVDQIIAELRAEKASIAQKEKDLKELATRLKAEQQELIAATQAVARLQREFDRNVTRVRDEEVANLKRLAKLYSTMTPEGASAVLKNLEDEQLIKVLVYMKETETAPIFESMAKAGAEDAKRVAMLSERLRLVLFRPPGAATK